MAEPTRKVGASAFLPEIGIPTWLNRIKTRRVANPTSPGPEDEPLISDNRIKHKPKGLNKGHVKRFRSRQGLRKGRKVSSRWFTSSLMYSDQASSASPSTEYSALEMNKPDKEDSRRKLQNMQKNISGDSPKISSTDKVSKCLKSFSHELGPKGGIQPVFPRAHSYNNLKELLKSLRSRFDDAKEAVNTELGYFSQEILEILQKPDSLTPDEYEMADELYVLAQQCIDMNSVDFRTKCETIVQDLTVKRQTCQAGLLKLLFTRILFIMTRCTRLLHFEKDTGPLNEKSLDKFRECLERIPSVDMNWVLNRGFADSDAGCVLKSKGDARPKFQVRNRTGVPSWATERMSKVSVDEPDTEIKNNYKSIEQKGPQTLLSDILSDGEQLHNTDGKFQMESMNMEKDNYSDDPNFVICRICEELVPAIHLETHSYVCAYADKCVSKHVDVDECLLELAGLLEHLLELRNSNSHESHASPDISKTRTTNFTMNTESYSPNCSEWRSKGIDGMLEDLHEMDTACIDDSHIANLINLKNHLLTKVSQCGPPSSNGSMTSTSSTNSPRSGNFDIFWLDQNNLSEQEDTQQIIDMADIARCVAGTDLSGEGSHEFLLACMQDLQEILQNSKHKALLVDTFGERIECLLREKYILACNLVDGANDTGPPESARSLLDSTSQSSTMSTPSHPLHKERTCIDDFDIIKPISRGAFGKVFLARKRTTGDLFAIKVLKKLDMLRKNDIDRILAERNILITVRNPFVVRFFYSFTSTDNLYLVMEYLNGGDLYSLLKKVGCLEEAVARTYLAELVLALEYLHSLGIVHRDIKPDNVLIAHDGHIKLTDFGLSKIGLMNCTTEIPPPDTEQLDVQPHCKPNPDTEDSCQSAVGTPDYLAPEILLGTEHGFASDWWSVGIIVFEFLTGTPPFSNNDPEIIFDNILNRKIPWPSVPTEMSYEAQDLIDSLLVHDPDQRLGAKGALEVKAHSFFSGVDWDNLTLQKAAFVPQPDSVDDTSYFVSRYDTAGIEGDESSIDSASDSSELHSNSALEKMDECGELAEFDSSPLDLSLMNFSFKNLSQLASINHDVLLQSGKDSSKCSTPCKGPKPLGF